MALSHIQKSMFFWQLSLPYQPPHKKISLLYLQKISHLKCFQWNAGQLLPPTHTSDLIKGPNTGVRERGKYTSVWGVFTFFHYARLRS